MRRGLVLGNWKMNGNGAQAASLLKELCEQLAGFSTADVGVCPPFPYIVQALDALAQVPIDVGAQNVAVEISGAFTGEVAAAMLADVGCHYVLVGHSERRALFAESDDMVAQKFARVLESGMMPVLCVGETLSQRDRGETLKVVGDQLQAVLARCGDQSLQGSAVAYEPVWAIGTGRTATPDQAQAVHEHLRSVLAAYDVSMAGDVRIVYGGSVNASNAAQLFAMADIDGALVGGASLDAGEFSTIARAAGT